jgi:hypothetical protein
MLAAAQQPHQLLALGSAQLDPVTYIHWRPPTVEGSTDESDAWRLSPPSAPGFTPKQGQYLAFIHAYTRVLGRAPAEADLQRHFRVTPPSVHQMMLTLERAGLIRRQPGVARSIKVVLDPTTLLVGVDAPKDERYLAKRPPPCLR